MPTLPIKGALKILIYSLNYAPDKVGIGKYSGELGSALSSRGFSVHAITAPPYFPRWVISSEYRNSYVNYYRENVLIHSCPLWVPPNPNSIARLIHLLSFALTSFFPLLGQRSWQPDVILTVAPAFFCAPGALMLTKLCGPSCVSWLHVQDFELDAAFELGMLKGKFLRRLAEVVEKSILHRFDCVSSISKQMVNKLESKGVAPSSTVLFPNWVNLDEIYPIPTLTRKFNCFRLKLNIPHDSVVLMYSGSMNQKQGLELIVEAIQFLSDIPGLFWLFAGEGPMKPYLLRATALFPQVIHFPLQPAELMNDWLNAADIHLLPQKAGAADLVLPSKLLGILASGRPVVATSTHGSALAELASEAGACTSPGDAHAFADALRHLIADPEQRLMAGKRARKLAEERFGKDAVLERFEQQLLSLVQSKRY